MSIEDFKKFGQMCADDEVVRAKAKDIGLEDIDGLAAYGRELGLKFTVNDLKQMAEEAGLMEEELSEDQLEKVAGGVATGTVAAVCAVVGAGAGVVSAGAAVAGVGIAAATAGTRGW
jgi:predicted ribosomally synthesized peptide with nif11-like leader